MIKMSSVLQKQGSFDIDEQITLPLRSLVKIDIIKE